MKRVSTPFGVRPVEFALGLLEDPDMLREQVQEERGRLLGASRAAEGVRRKLDGLQQERDALIGRAAAYSP